MAKNTFNKKARSLQPAVMKLNFVLPLNASNYVVDLSECVSRLNRRFMRQGLNWAVGNVKLTTLPASVEATGATSYVNTIPHTWSVANAWMKAFSAWKLQQDQAIAASGSESSVARFRDFKISLEDNIADAGHKMSPVSIGPGRLIGPFMTGLVSGSAVAPAEDWDPSKVVVPNDGATGNTVSYLLHMVGPDTPTSKGLIAGYAASRAYPQSPDPVGPVIGSSDNWLGLMFDTGDDHAAVTFGATQRNDELPYDQDEYPGGATNFNELECQGYKLNQSTVGMNVWNTGPFTAPCGLIRFDFANQQIIGSTDYNQNVVTIDLVPGNHRGYLCETMEAF
jgi:hypothetical protein